MKSYDLYELWEAIKELKEDTNLVFKLVIQGKDKVIREESKYGEKHYLVVCNWCGCPFIREMRIRRDGSVDYIDALQMDESCKWIKTNELVR